MNCTVICALKWSWKLQFLVNRWVRGKVMIIACLCCNYTCAACLTCSPHKHCLFFSTSFFTMLCCSLFTSLSCYSSFATFRAFSDCLSSATSSAHLLTPCSTVLLEKLTGLQLVKKFPAFYGTRRFITALTSARHLSLSCASSLHPLHTGFKRLSLP